MKKTNQASKYHSGIYSETGAKSKTASNFVYSTSPDKMGSANYDFSPGQSSTMQSTLSAENAKANSKYKAKAKSQKGQSLRDRIDGINRTDSRNPKNYTTGLGKEISSVVKKTFSE